jgi:hypothetical protein
MLPRPLTSVHTLASEGDSLPRAIQVVLYAFGALAVLVVVNWARQELVVGIAVACLLIAATTIPALRKAEATEDEGGPSSG